MGKGDIKTKRGKIRTGSYGVTRKRADNKKQAAPVAKAEKPKKGAADSVAAPAAKAKAKSTTAKAAGTAKTAAAKTPAAKKPKKASE